MGDVAWRQGRLNEARAYLDESLALARALGDTTRTMFALNRLGAVALNRGDLDEAERLLTEVHALALAVGNRERAMHALNNLGEVAKQRSNLVMARAYHQQALDLAREIGARQQTAGFLLNLADDDIKLRDLRAARAELRQGLVLARALGVTWVLTAVPSYCAHLAAAEGDMARALALYGLARRHPAWSGENQRELERDLAAWGLDAAAAEAGLARGAELDFDTTVAELLGEE
jgi:tetratricopeptide (TPR) repeat protein